MKKTVFKFGNLFVILFAIAVFTTCKKDEDPEDNLIGTWVAGTPELNAMIGDKTLTQYFIDVMHATPADAQLYNSFFNLTLQQYFTGSIQFKPDNTYTLVLGGQSETGTWIMSSDGNKLTLDPDSGFPIILDIVQISSSVLHVKWVESFSDDINQDGTPEIIITNIDITFTKQ